MRRYARTIICPIFADTDCDSTLRCAGFLAKSYGARLLVVNVKPTERSRDNPGEPGAQVRELSELEGIHFPQLEGVRYERFEMVGEPITGLVDFVERMDGDMVVIANSAPADGISALGWMTARVAGSLPCTTVIVKDLQQIANNPFHSTPTGAEAVPAATIQ